MKHFRDKFPGNLAVILVISGCVFSAGFATLQVQEEPEVISLLDRGFYATPAQGEDLEKLEADLAEAIKNLEADPDNPELIVWHGRRLGYLWRYHDAIDVYTAGITKHPDHAMLYRHRGHRYISVRNFQRAAADLTRAAELEDSDFDIWYHLGLAHYLNGDFEKAREAYLMCRKTAANDDSLVAIYYWLYLTHRRLGEEQLAEDLLEGIGESMNIEENHSYFNLLLFYKGIKSLEETETRARASDLDLATTGFGLATWYLVNSEEAKAISLFEQIIEGKYWPAFGFIAAEAELASRKK